ncbi:hypothetical protein ACJJTC_004275, partial [Scirpophaga incertulas]
MSPEWENLPLLPLRCILSYLRMEDAMAAMSVCRHWHSAVPLYEGHKETLKLRARKIEKSLFLTRMFRKNVKKLYIYLDGNHVQLDKFMSCVLPQYFETHDLKELVFLGSGHIHQIQTNVPNLKLSRVIVETFIMKHSNSLRRLALLGCEIGNANENDRFIHKHVEYHSRQLSFKPCRTPADLVISRCNSLLMVFSGIQHIILNYESVTADALETLSELGNFSYLTMNLVYRKQVNYKAIDWDRVKAFYPRRLETNLNVVGVPHNRLDDLMDTVLRSGMNLVSLKVMFCRTFSGHVLELVVRFFKDCLRELVWADAPFPSAERAARFMNTSTQELTDVSLLSICHMNPFILLCWQCTRLRTLAIHGYWVWQYDVVGFARLRRSLSRLEVPAIYERQGRFPEERATVRVLAGDAPTPPGDHLVNVSHREKSTTTPTPNGFLYGGPNYIRDFYRIQPPKIVPTTFYGRLCNCLMAEDVTVINVSSPVQLYTKICFFFSLN